MRLPPESTCLLSEVGPLGRAVQRRLRLPRPSISQNYLSKTVSITAVACCLSLVYFVPGLQRPLCVREPLVSSPQTPTHLSSAQLPGFPVSRGGANLEVSPTSSGGGRKLKFWGCRWVSEAFRHPEGEQRREWNVNVANGASTWSAGDVNVAARETSTSRRGRRQSSAKIQVGVVSVRVSAVLTPVVG